MIKIWSSSVVFAQIGLKEFLPVVLTESSASSLSVWVGWSVLTSISDLELAAIDENLWDWVGQSWIVIWLVDFTLLCRILNWLLLDASLEELKLFIGLKSLLVLLESCSICFVVLEKTWHVHRRVRGLEILKLHVQFFNFSLVSSCGAVSSGFTLFILDNLLSNWLEIFQLWKSWNLIIDIALEVSEALRCLPKFFLMINNLTLVRNLSHEIWPIKLRVIKSILHHHIKECILSDILSVCEQDCLSCLLGVGESDQSIAEIDMSILELHRFCHLVLSFVYLTRGDEVFNGLYLLLVIGMSCIFRFVKQWRLIPVVPQSFLFSLVSEILRLKITVEISVLLIIINHCWVVPHEFCWVWKLFCQLLDNGFNPDDVLDKLSLFVIELIKWGLELFLCSF